MHHPLIDHTEFVQHVPPIQRRYSICTILGYMCIATTITVFTFSDIIIAYSSSPCYQTDAAYNPFPIQVWIALSGYMGAVLLTSSMFYHSRNSSIYQRLIVLVNDTLLIVMFLWNIMGLIILLLHYKDYFNCSVSIVVYMIVRLSVGISMNVLQYYLDYQPIPQ